MSKNDKKPNDTSSKKQAKTVPVAGDLSVPTNCVKKTVGSSKEV